MSFFVGLSSSSVDNKQPKRTEVISTLYTQINWNELIKSDILRQRDVRYIIV